MAETLFPDQYNTKMKKLIFIATIALALSTTVQAQIPEIQPVRAGDTLVNTDTLTREFTFSDGYAGIILTPVVTKLSGTVAGTVRFFVSPNGVDYPTTAADSLVLSNTTSRQFPATGFRLTAPVSYKVKIVFISSGTQSYKTEFYVLGRKYAGNTGGPFGYLQTDPGDLPFYERLNGGTGSGTVNLGSGVTDLLYRSEPVSLLTSPALLVKRE